MLLNKIFDLRKVIYYLLLLFLFILPWQTRWVYRPAYLRGVPWEYGSGSIYATQVLLGIILSLFILDLVKNHDDRGVLPPPRGGVPFAGQHASTFGESKKFILAFWLGGVGQGLLAVWQFFTQSITTFRGLGIMSRTAASLGGDFVIEAASGRWLRAYGSFGSPNILGGFLAVCLVIGVIIYLRLTSPPPTPSAAAEGVRDFPSVATEGNEGRTRWLIIGLSLGQLIILSGLILSFSRGAWIAAGVGIAVLAVVVRVETHSYASLQRLAKQLSLFVFVIILFLITLQPLFTARLTGAGRLEQRSISERVGQFSDFKKIFYSRPFFGVGAGEYTYALWHADKWQPAWRYQPIHNTYLLILAEIGIVGFAIVSVFLYFIISHIRHSNPIFLSLIAVILASALFDHFWWSLYSGQMILLAVIGLGIKKSLD